MHKSLGNISLSYFFDQLNFKDMDNINIFENGESHQARFSFASFYFVGHPDGSPMYSHCQVQICDSTKTTCKPDCESRKRRSESRDYDEGHHMDVVSFPIMVENTPGACKKDCRAGICKNSCFMSRLERIRSRIFG